MSKAKAPQAMLACAIENVADIEAMLPLIASPKLDGVRAMVIDNSSMLSGVITMAESQLNKFREDGILEFEIHP